MARRPEPSTQAAAPSRRRFMKFASAAATVGVALATGWYAWQVRGERVRISTKVGEQRSIPLEDGSVVFLNTDSQITIHITKSERRVALTQGEARFTVAKDKLRPFVVITPHAAVRALGTVFNVQIGSSRTAVAVLEGKIEVRGTGNMGSAKDPLLPFGSGETDEPETSGQSIVLETGEKAAVTPRGEILPNAGPPMDRVKAWPEGRLVFRQEPLGEIIEEFNRYNKVAISIADPSIAEYRISGTFGAYDRNSLLAYLAKVEELKIEQAADGSVLLVKRPVRQAVQ